MPRSGAAHHDVQAGGGSARQIGVACPPLTLLPVTMKRSACQPTQSLTRCTPSFSGQAGGASAKFLYEPLTPELGEDPSSIPKIPDPIDWPAEYWTEKACQDLAACLTRFEVGTTPRKHLNALHRRLSACVTGWCTTERRLPQIIVNMSNMFQLQRRTRVYQPSRTYQPMGWSLRN